jgi:hypothetical protein
MTFKESFDHFKKRAMKKLLIIVFVCAGFCVFSQDLGKILQNGTWYITYEPKSGKTIGSKNTLARQPESFEFKENGKMIRCGTLEESSLDKNGKEIKSVHFRCDSIRHYEIKNGMMKIQVLKQSPDHYKIALKGETFELTPVKPEEYK